jgi:hypothetical protein
VSAARFSRPNTPSVIGTLFRNVASPYTGYCSQIPPEQLDIRALTTTIFYNTFGNPISGLSSQYVAR